MRILFFGDIYGEPGLRFFKANIDNIKKKYKPNIIILNGENASLLGKGLSLVFYKHFMEAGVSLITGGNWIYHNKKAVEKFSELNVIRPANVKEAPGIGYKIMKFNNQTILVLNLLGRVFNNVPTESPFDTAKKILTTEKYDYALVDFHAEATSEKVALGLYLDGLASIVVGTHTHVLTADEKVLPKKTLYISDAGMTGLKYGVIGVDYDPVIKKFLNGYGETATITDGVCILNAVLFDLQRQEITKIIIDEENN